MAHKTALVLVFLCLTLAPLRGQAPPSKEAQAGWQAIQAGDANAAATAFYTALAREPRDGTLHLGAGIAAHMLGRDRDAVVSLRRALDLEPRLFEAAELLAHIEYAEGDLDDAIRLYEQALPHARGADAREMRGQLDEWKKEAAVHSGLKTRNDGRFSIVFDGRSDDALATHAVTVLEAAFARIGRAIGAYPSNRVLLTLYTEQQFRDITKVPAWADGAFDGKIRLAVQGASQNLKGFDRVLAHELTHAIVTSLAPRGVPGWLHEGLASYFEPVDPNLAQQRIRTLGIAFPLSRLQGSFAHLTPEQASVAYAESVVAADVLLRLLGTRTASFLQDIGGGQSFDQSLERVGIHAADFDAQVMGRLQRPQAPR